MNIKSYKNIILFGAGFVGISALYFLFVASPFYKDFEIWAQDYTIVLFLIIVVIKVIGIVWPPIPGGILTLGAIPIIGWELAYLSDLTGSLIGSALAFLISRKYGKEILGKLFDDSVVAKVENLKIKPNRQLEMLIILLTFGGSTVIEVIAYGAGLIKRIRFQEFMLARLIAHPILGIPTFFLIGNIIEGDKVLVNAVFLALLLPLMWVLRHRYIDL